MKLRVERIDDVIEVFLLPCKDGSGYSFINLTKGHICPCKFMTIKEAIMDMAKNKKVKNFTQIKEE